MKEFLEIQSSKINKIDLTLFDDGDQGGDAGGGDDGGTGGQGDQGGGDGGNAGKTFTQSQLDAIIADRVARADAKADKALKNSDDYKAYEKYKADQQTADEKRKGELEAIEATKGENAALKAQLEGIANEKKLSSANIDPDFNEFVMHQVNKGVNDKTDFDASLKAFAENEANAKYIIAQDSGDNNHNDGNFNTGRRHNKNNNSGASVADGMLARLGYAQKASK